MDSKKHNKKISLENYWDSTSSEERIDTVERAFQMIEKQKEYIALLGKEIADIVLIAYNHGWRSERVEQGKTLRKEMLDIEG